MKSSPMEVTHIASRRSCHATSCALTSRELRSYLNIPSSAPVSIILFAAIFDLEEKQNNKYSGRLVEIVRNVADTGVSIQKILNDHVGSYDGDNLLIVCVDLAVSMSLL